MKRNFSSFALCAFSLVACSSKTDVNETNFGAAINRYLDEKGELCLGINTWPVDVTQADLKFRDNALGGKARRMEALADLGLVSASEAEVDQLRLFNKKPTGQKFKVMRYVLTDEGKKYYREKEIERIDFKNGGKKKVVQGDLCYGKKVLDKVVKWEGPMKFGDYQEAKVVYLYKIEGLADWAKNPGITTSFPKIGSSIEGAGSREQQGAVKLTSEGWEPKGLN